MSKIVVRVDTLEDVISKVRLDENRFLNCCLLGENQKVKFKEETYYPVDICKYAELGGISRGRALEELIGICAKHKESFNLMVGETAVLCTSLIYEFRHDKECGTLHINWNPKLIPYISGVMQPGKYLTLDVVMVGTSSGHRYKLYTLLQKHLWKLDHTEYGVVELSEENIRKVLGLTTEYNSFRTLNAKIIKPTLVEIANKTGKHLQCRLSKGKAVITYKELQNA